MSTFPGKSQIDSMPMRDQKLDCSFRIDKYLSSLQELDALALHAD